MSKLQKYCLVDYLVFTKKDDLFINEALSGLRGLPITYYAHYYVD